MGQTQPTEYVKFIRGLRRLQGENNRLSKTIEGLKMALRQEKLAVQQREGEIPELEKTRKEIQSSLKEQIAQKYIKMKKIQG